MQTSVCASGSNQTQIQKNRTAPAVRFFYAGKKFQSVCSGNYAVAGSVAGADISPAASRLYKFTGTVAVRFVPQCFVYLKRCGNSTGRSSCPCAGRDGKCASRLPADESAGNRRLFCYGAACPDGWSSPASSKSSAAAGNCNCR